MDKINVGISACLLGQEVRFDGGHKLNRYITEVLGKYFNFHPLCPEVAIGLGIPRPSLRLLANTEGTQAIMPSTKANYTKDLRDYANMALPKLPQISGYILKKNSPSCGMARVKVYQDSGMPKNEGVGIFAKRLMEKLSLLPVEEDGRLCDPKLRENFIKRVYIYAEWQRLCATRLTHHDLIAFHSRHKLLLIAHHYGNSKLLGKMIANLKTDNVTEVTQAYITLFMQTLKRLPDRRHHGQVLHRVVTSINQHLAYDQKRDILAMIDEYLKGYVALATPIRMIRHYLKHVHVPYLDLQSYFHPYPDELGLMNDI